MDVLPALFITIIIILFIIIIVVVIFLTTETPPPKYQCTQNSDCDSGYICQSNVCKAGTGTVCAVDNDCESGLTCQNKICIFSQSNTNEKINLPQFPNITPEKNLDLKLKNLENSRNLENLENLKKTNVNLPQRYKLKPLKQKQTKKLNNPIPQKPKKILIIENVVQDLRIIDHMIGKDIPKKDITKKYIYYSSSSSDDEINSEGDFSDQPFDIISDEDSFSDDNGYESDENFYTKISKNSNIGEYKYINSIPIIDICSYSNIIIFLLNDNTILCEVNDTMNYKYKVSNNISIKKILTFDGYIYSVSTDQKLYFLSNNYLNASLWKWESVSWSPENIKYISSTYDSNYLWIQTENEGFLFRENGILVSTQKIIDIKRVYGYDVDHYLEIDINQFKATSYPDKKSVDNISDGILDYHNNIVYISFDEIDVYRSIVIINWKPFFIKW
jgi:hypothetical protein